MEWRTTVLMLLVGQAIAENCWNGSEPSLGLSMLTDYNVSINAEDVLKGPLYQLGKYEECIYRRKLQYCLVDVHLSPGDNPDPFWFRIKELTAVKTNYRRDQLRVGLCVPETCNRPEVESAMFDKLETAARDLGIHLNITLQHRNCQNRYPTTFTIADYIIGALFLSILGLILLGTVYDGCTITQIPEKRENTKVTKLLICFSLITNWNRLGAVSSSPKSKALRCIHGIRTFSLYFIITGHGFFFTVQSPFTDPEFVEMSYLDLPSTFIFNGYAILGTYFCVSGFLLGYMSIEALEESGFTFRNYFKAFIHRYIRLTPAYAMMIALGATWFNYLGSGPLWPTMVSTEVENCRHHWWINLLYLNNYFYADKPCLLHTWYLAADFQNYLVSLLILGVVNKYRRWAKAILASVLLIWMIIPFVQTYIEELDPMPISYPETVRHLTLNKSYLRNYITFHHNAASYFVGVIFGYTYFKISSQGIKIPKVMVALLWLISLTVPWTIILLGHIFFLPSYVYDSIASSFYAAFCKVLYAAGIGAILLGCCRGYGWIANTTLSWKPIQVIGRLTYCVYLVHFCVQRLEAGALKEPVTISAYYGVHSGFGDIIVSFGLGLILCLCIELPTSSLMKFSKDSGDQKQEQTSVIERSFELNKNSEENRETTEKLIALAQLQNDNIGVSTIAV